MARVSRNAAEARDHVLAWDLRESGPADAAHTMLLLPGGLCTGVFYEDVMAAPVLAGASVRLVAATVPGFGRTAYPDDLSMENYARLAGALAAQVRADVVVGHSMGANVAIEMAGAGEFSGPMVLLSPSFSREDEFKPLRVLDGLGRIPALGPMVWALAMRAMPRGMKASPDPARQKVLVADLANNDPGFCRRSVRRYLEYLDHHGSLVPRLCDSGVEACVVFGEHDEIGLTDEERSGLEACPSIRMATVADAGHMMLTEKPEETAALILEALSWTSDSRPGSDPNAQAALRGSP